MRRAVVLNSGSFGPKHPAPAPTGSYGRMSPREFAVDVVRKLQSAGFAAYWAGGCVRDLLLERPPKDYDVATDARPDTVRALFGPRRTRAVGAAFGVILVHGPKGAGDVEVATFRAEGPYLDGRRPDHVVFCTAEEDAQRRDFTINGIFYDPLTEKVFDYVGGQADLQRRIVRAIGDPFARFQEDKLRLLRAVRFAATLEFQLDPPTAAAVRAMSPEIHVVSAERITEELRRMLEHPHRVLALELTRESRLLHEILPELNPLIEPAAKEGAFADWNHVLQVARALEQPRFPVALAAILQGVPELSADGVHALCRRLRLSNEETEQIGWLVAQQDALAGAAQLPLAELKRLASAAHFLDLLAIARARAHSGQLDRAAVAFCERFLQETPADRINPPPFVTGQDLIALGLRPGPRFKDLLDRIREEQLAERVSSREAALGLLAGWLAIAPEQDAHPTQSAAQ